MTSLRADLGMGEERGTSHEKKDSRLCESNDLVLDDDRLTLWVNGSDVLFVHHIARNGCVIDLVIIDEVAISKVKRDGRDHDHDDTEAERSLLVKGDFAL